MKRSTEMLIDAKFRLIITLEKIPHANHYHSDAAIIKKVMPWIKTALQQLLLSVDEPDCNEPVITEMKICMRQGKHEHKTENVICSKIRYP